MSRSTLLLIFFLFFGLAFFAQTQRRPTRPVPKKSVVTETKPVSKHQKKANLAFGLGVARSVVYLARNVKPDNDATGIHGTLVYNASRFIRTSLEYTRYQTLDIAPTWYNIKASTVELNMHLLTRFKKTDAYFYPLVGLSYNLFSGRYTGVNDFLHLNTIYHKNQYTHTSWWGLNVGTGYELFFRPGSFFLDYKMRVGVTEGSNQINIQDVCIMAGLRFNLRVPSLYSIFMYKGTRSRYLLDKSDED